MKVKIENVDKTLREAMSQPRREYHNYYENALRKQLMTLHAEFEKNGMDRQIVAPYPASNLSRTAYFMAKDKYEFASRFYRNANVSQGWLQPCPVVQITEAEIDAKLDQMAAEATAKHFDGYIIKLADKIGKPIKVATLVGSLWSDSTLRITTKDGEKQEWHTQCIFNTSCLGKIFNQWPTRRKD
jgi:hypothetical protein